MRGGVLVAAVLACGCGKKAEPAGRRDEAPGTEGITTPDATRSIDPSEVPNAVRDVARALTVNVAQVAIHDPAAIRVKKAAWVPAKGEAAASMKDLIDASAGQDIKRERAGLTREEYAKARREGRKVAEPAPDAPRPVPVTRVYLVVTGAPGVKKEYRWVIGSDEAGKALSYADSHSKDWRDDVGLVVVPPAK